MTNTRQTLLDAARRCVAAHGLAATTSRQIAGAAGANLASITYHFGSKDRLVAEAVLEGLRAGLAPAMEVLRGGGDASARTVAAIQALTSSFEAHREDAAAYVEALVHAPRLPALQAGLSALWDELKTTLSDHIGELRRQGQLAGWVEPDATSSLLIAVANGLVVATTVDPEGPSLSAMAAQFGALLLAARQTS